MLGQAWFVSAYLAAPLVTPKPSPWSFRKNTGRSRPSCLRKSAERLSSVRVLAVRAQLGHRFARSCPSARCLPSSMLTQSLRWRLVPLKRTRAMVRAIGIQSSGTRATSSASSKARGGEAATRSVSDVESRPTSPGATRAGTQHVGETAAAAAALRAAAQVDLLPGQRAVLQAASRRIGATPAAAAAAGTARTAEFDAAVRGLAGRPPGTTVLTPHDGEFRALTGQPVSANRFADVRRLAAATGAVVLLKGPTTLVASPEGWVDVVTTGDQRLATAGTGDVLAGVIGALLAQGLSAQKAASVGAWLHGTAASNGLAAGLVAGDLPALVAAVVSQLSEGSER